MNILHISSLDRGGSTAFRRLHHGLLDAGYESDVLTMDSFGGTRRRKTFYHAQKSENIDFTEKIKIKLGLRSPHQLYDKQGLQLEGYDLGYGFTFPESLEDITTHRLYQKADIIHLHWVNRMIDYPTFFSKNTKPIVWTLHDMHPFTGGLHYTIGTNYTSEELIDYIHPEKNSFDELLNHNIKIKKQSIQNQQIVIVPTSNKIQELSQKSQIFSNFSHELIPLGLDTTIFKPYRKSICREIFDIPFNVPVLVFVSADLKNKFKGLPLLLEAISGLKNPPHLLAIGQKNNDLAHLSNITFTGYISDEKLMAMAYSAGDFFVTPSLEEAFGQTTIEAMSCGLPVISFATWGAMDLIDKTNGIMVKNQNANDLRNAIKEILLKKIQFDSEVIRMQAVNKYQLEIFIQSHLDLYQKICNKKATGIH